MIDPVRITKLGDSLTYEVVSGGDTSLFGVSGQGHLYATLTGAGFPVQMVGTQHSNPSGEVWDHHEGYPGATFLDMDARIPFVMGTLKPHIVCIMGGLNSIGKGETVFAPYQLANLIDDIHIANRDTLILVSPMTPVTGPSASLAPAVADLNAQYPGVIEPRRVSGRRVVWCPVVAGSVQVSDLGAVDGAHLTTLGYTHLNDGWALAISRWIHIFN